MRIIRTGILAVVSALLGVAGGYLTVSRDLETGASPSQTSHSPAPSKQKLVHELRQVGQLASPEECVHAWETAKHDPKTRKWLLMRWSVVDPESAIEHLRDDDWGAVKDLFKYWAIRDPDAALTHLRTLPEEQIEAMEFNVYQALLTHHGAQPMIDLAINYEAEGILSVNSYDSILSKAFSQWAEQNLQASLDRATSLQGTTRSAALAGIGKAWAAVDEQAALAWARELSGEDGDLAFQAVVESIIAETPHRVAEFLGEMKDPFSYSTRLMGAGSNALKTLTKEDPVAALQWIADHVSEEHHNQAVSMVFTQEAMASNPRLIPQAIAAADESVQSSAIQSLVHYARASSIDPAIKGTLELPQGELRDRIMGALIGAWAYEDPRHALKYVQELERHYAGDLATGKEQIARMIASRHPQDPAGWELITQLPEMSQDNLAAHSIRELAEGGEFLDLAVERLHAHPWKDEHDQRLLIGRIAQQGARSDPAKTLAWLQSESSEIDLTEGYNEFFYYASASIEDAISQLSTLSHGPNRDAAIDGFVRRHATTDLDTAQAWAESIEDPVRRENALNRLNPNQP